MNEREVRQALVTELWKQVGMLGTMRETSAADRRALAALTVVGTLLKRLVNDGADPGDPRDLVFGLPKELWPDAPGSGEHGGDA